MQLKNVLCYSLNNILRAYFTLIDIQYGEHFQHNTKSTIVSVILLTISLNVQFSIDSTSADCSTRSYFVFF